MREVGLLGVCICVHTRGRKKGGSGQKKAVTALLQFRRALDVPVGPGKCRHYLECPTDARAIASMDRRKYPLFQSVVLWNTS